MKAELIYCIDTGVKPVNETKVAGATPEYTGTFGTRWVEINDGRTSQEQFSLDEEGFEFVRHDTQVRDFLDPEEIKAAYYPEIQQLVKDHSGATRVDIFDHTVRSGDDSVREEHKVRELVKRVHNDYTDWSGPERVRNLYSVEEAEELLNRRFAIIQVWRPIRATLIANHLAMCDAQTLRAEDLIATDRRFPDRVGETYQVAFNEGHKWFYFPQMKRNEAIIFKVYDSEKNGKSRFVAHTSFDDPDSPADAPPRESIEMRTFAFF